MLDPADRQLSRGGVPVELNARYLDALSLLVRERGRLVSKDRFLDEVWRGVPVTDEALTQCIKTLRRQLGDDAARPRFIETVPKHGYRFIAGVTDDEVQAPAVVDRRNAPAMLMLGLAGAVGGGGAGFAGGLLYGFGAATSGGGPAVGAASMLLVLLCLCILVGATGGAGVGFGIAFASRHGDALRILGGAAGGLIIGAVVKLLGVDAFNLLLGRAPGAITGGMEGALIGAAAGFGSVVAVRRTLRLGAIAGAVAGALTGAAIALMGGRLMAGSLALLAGQFPESSLRLDLFGEGGFGPISALATAALEGALFCACVVTAMTLAARQLTERQQ